MASSIQFYPLSCITNPIYFWIFEDILETTGANLLKTIYQNISSNQTYKECNIAIVESEPSGHSEHTALKIYHQHIQGDLEFQKTSEISEGVQ